MREVGTNEVKVETSNSKMSIEVIVDDSATPEEIEKSLSLLPGVINYYRWRKATSQSKDE